MRRTNFRRAAAFGLLATVAACGGGGGGGGGSPTIPGTLAALAVEGASAPGYAGSDGLYGSFGTSAKIAAADGGWSAFVADTTGGSASKALFVATPSGSVSRVFQTGDFLPDSTPGTGTISNFGRIFVVKNGAYGIVVALVDGTNPTQGFVTAVVNAAGAVSEKHGAIYIGKTLTASVSGAIPGALTAIDATLISVDNAGSVFFHGTGTGGSPVHGIYFASRDGLTVQPAVASGDPMVPSGTAGIAFDGLGISSDGSLVAFSVNVLGGPSLKAVFAITGGFIFILAKNGDTPPLVGAQTFEDVHPAGPIYVNVFNSHHFVTWGANLSGSSPDLGVFSHAVPPIAAYPNTITLLAAGESAAGDAGTGAVYGNITALPCPNSSDRITLEALISGGNTDRIYWSYAVPAVGTDFFAEVYREGDGIPGGSAFFANTYPSYATATNSATDLLGSPAFTATLSDATTGVFWDVISNGLYTVAKQGDAAPGTAGGTFLPFGTPAAVTTATGQVLFRAALSAGIGPTGLFRQH